MKLPIPIYDLTSTVYLRINREKKGMVTGLTIRPGGVVLYLVTWGEGVEEKEHWGCELSDEQIYSEGSGGEDT